MALTPTTKLEAVNVCLTNIGEAPVASLTGLQVDAQVASSIIDEVSREVQSNGWHWNTEVHTISPIFQIKSFSLQTHFVLIRLRKIAV
jgi:hypothetical protein